MKIRMYKNYNVPGFALPQYWPDPLVDDAYEVEIEIPDGLEAYKNCHGDWLFAPGTRPYLLREILVCRNDKPCFEWINNNRRWRRVHLKEVRI